MRPFDPGPRVRYEWAVIEYGFRGAVYVHQGDLGSREEAELWLAALKVTLKRQNHEHFMATDGMIAQGELRVARREIARWEAVES